MSLYIRIRNKLFPNSPVVQRHNYARKQSPEIRVLMAGLMMSTNLGDGVISDCVQYLIRKAAKENGIKKVKITTRDIRKEKTKAQLAAVRNSDAVIFPGGGLIKYRVENLPVAMERVMSRAEHYGIPVAFNAVGVEGFDGEDEGCQLLCNMLASSCVKSVTSRDYADFLNENYLTGELKAYRVSDPAVWASQAYDIQQDPDSQVVGLGVARAGLFEDYGTSFSKEDLLKLWGGIIAQLDSKNIKWKLFTNGFAKDEEFLRDLVQYIGREANFCDIAVPVPKTPAELVHNISQFRGIIACRMHANIVAYSMGIPCVGLVWNDKLRFFGESIGCKKQFITADKLTADYVVSVLFEALDKGFDKNIAERERASAYESIADFLVPFANELVSCRRRDLTDIKLVCYGLPNLNSDKLNTELFKTSVEYFVSDDEALIGTQCLGKPVYSTKKLRRLFGRKPFVIISETIDYYPAAEALKSMGYKERYDFTNMHSYKRYIFKKGDVFVDKPVIEV
ncbi:MAG: polysaccharide pyruvyl transferase family protein [Ruminococcus sp.]|nr:polysaccharide pyruvyl transferase family protein [Ruminococcus sp.]